MQTDDYLIYAAANWKFSGEVIAARIVKEKDHL